MTFGQDVQDLLDKKAASPPKILQILFILSKNKVGTVARTCPGIFFKVPKGQKFLAHPIFEFSRPFIGHVPIPNTQFPNSPIPY
jgi:hypothetical protein